MVLGSLGAFCTADRSVEAMTESLPRLIGQNELTQDERARSRHIACRVRFEKKSGLPPFDLNGFKPSVEACGRFEVERNPHWNEPGTDYPLDNEYIGVMTEAVRSAVPPGSDVVHPGLTFYVSEDVGLARNFVRMIATITVVRPASVEADEPTAIIRGTHDDSVDPQILRHPDLRGG